MLQPITPTSTIVKQNISSKRNRFPKFSLNFSIVFQLPTGEFSVDAQEISHEEVRITCKAGDIPLLVPRTAHHCPNEKITHDAVLQLNNDFKIPVKLQVLHCRRYSQQGFNVALRILELNEAQQTELEVFLSTALEKNIPTANMFG